MKRQHDLFMQNKASQWRRDQGKEAMQLPPSPYAKFWAVEKLSKNLLLVGKFSYKNAKFGAQKLILEEI